eukprot:896976-Lingulodinium_polyedra.AAC.1
MATKSPGHASNCPPRTGTLETDNTALQFTNNCQTALVSQTRGLNASSTHPNRNWHQRGTM